MSTCTAQLDVPVGMVRVSEIKMIGVRGSHNSIRVCISFGCLAVDSDNNWQKTQCGLQRLTSFSARTNHNYLF